MAARSLIQNTIGSKTNKSKIHTASPTLASTRVFDGLRLNRRWFFATITNYLQYPLHVWVSGLLSLHEP